MVTTRITWQSYLLVQLHNVVEDVVVTHRQVPHCSLLNITPWLPTLPVEDPPLEKLHKRLDDFLPTIVQRELSGDCRSPDCVAKVEVFEGLPNIVAVVQPGASDDIPNRGVASKANAVEAMVDKDSPGDRLREAGVVLVHAVGLDKVGATTEQDVADVVGRGGRHIDGWQEGKSNFDGDSSLYLES